MFDFLKIGSNKQKNIYILRCETFHRTLSSLISMIEGLDDEGPKQEVKPGFFLHKVKFATESASDQPRNLFTQKVWILF